MVSPANYYQHSARHPSSHRVLLPSKITRVFVSPQNLPFAKFIPQWSHLLLPVFLQLSSPVEAKSIPQHQPRIRLPGTRQGFIFLRRKHTFIKRHIHHYSMHMHHTTRISLILKTYMHHDFAYNYVLPFRKKINTKMIIIN